MARAFREHARRGTVRSLQRLVARATGATPIVTELGIPGPWALGETPLGFESALAPAAPQPAVVNSTAIVNASSLLRDEDIGVSAFEPYAHRFTVEVPMYALRPNTTLSQVALVVDREKPAHTTYALCGMHARARVGVAARVGMDAIVAGPPLPSPLGSDAVDGFVLADGGTAHALPRVGTVTAS